MRRIVLSTLAFLLLSGGALLRAEDAKTAAAAQPAAKQADSAAPAKAAKTATAAKGAKSAKSAKGPDHVLVAPSDIKWGDAPPMLPPGAKAAVLEGDPAKAGAFTIRLRLPDGYKVAPHWHPTVEHVTVISGTFHLAMGDTFDDSKGTALPAGGFGYMGAKMHHYGWATGETEIQVHGMGPFVLHYLNPADDPQHGKK